MKLLPLEGRAVVGARDTWAGALPEPKYRIWGGIIGGVPPKLNVGAEVDVEDDDGPAANVFTAATGVLGANDVDDKASLNALPWLLAASDWGKLKGAGVGPLEKDPSGPVKGFTGAAPVEDPSEDVVESE